MYIYTCVYTYIHMYIYTYMCVYDIDYSYVHMYVYTYTCIYDIDVSTYKCTHTSYTNVYKYTYMHQEREKKRDDKEQVGDVTVGNFCLTQFVDGPAESLWHESVLLAQIWKSWTSSCQLLVQKTVTKNLYHEIRINCFQVRAMQHRKPETRHQYCQITQ